MTLHGIGWTPDWTIGSKRDTSFLSLPSGKSPPTQGSEDGVFPSTKDPLQRQRPQGLGIGDRYPFTPTKTSPVSKTLRTSVQGLVSENSYTRLSGRERVPCRHKTMLENASPLPLMACSVRRTGHEHPTFTPLTEFPITTTTTGVEPETNNRNLRLDPPLTTV